MVKRIFDLVGASVLLVVASPVIVAAAAVSVLTYRASPFFTQVRTGRHGRPFRLVKIRTLDPSTPQSLPKLELEDHRPGAPCRFLRAHHLDELPQLIHVLTGSMSLVGPRPEMVALQEAFPSDFARRRAEVRPGITGLWQISRAVEQMIVQRPEFDLFYVANRSLRLDLWILWRTASGLVGRAAIESLDDVPSWAARQWPIDDEVDRVGV